MVIGHEFTHGLDDKGSKFDQFGNLRNWFGEDGLKRFRNRSECFVQQYGSQVEPLTGLNVSDIYFFDLFLKPLKIYS